MVYFRKNRKKIVAIHGQIRVYRLNKCRHISFIPLYKERKSKDQNTQRILFLNLRIFWNHFLIDLNEWSKTLTVYFTVNLCVGFKNAITVYNGEPFFAPKRCRKSLHCIENLEQICQNHSFTQSYNRSFSQNYIFL